MQKTNIRKHVPLPKETPAFFCGNCGVVSLSSSNICNPQGKLKKVDWCGSKDLPEAKVVLSYGGQIHLMPTVPGRSTTAMIERIRKLQEGR